MTADASGPDPYPANDGGRLSDPQRSLRAQLLATEHWGLLASRSTAQSEVLTRIAIFLTLVSAGLVTLGVLGNATQFRGWFGVAALGVLFLLVVLGVITQQRVVNVGLEDLAYVLAMNRLRGAYLDLDPGLEPYFLLSPHDDQAGSTRTYYPFAVRSGSQVFASSMMLILVVESALAGLFLGSLTFALIGGAGWAIGVGVAGLLASLGTGFVGGYRGYRSVWTVHDPLRPTPTGPPRPDATR
jgi:hypothetical protein